MGGDEAIRGELVKYSRKKFARKREEISERKSSDRNSSRKTFKANKRPKKKSQVKTEPMIDEI